MKMSKEKRALIAGMIGCLLYVIGDFLFAATGKSQSTESIGLMVKVAYLDMATWRMVVSIICGVLGTALYYIGFHQMWKLLKQRLTQPKQQKWVKLFQIAYLTGTVCWGYVHAMFMNVALIFKFTFEKYGDMQAAAEIANKVFYCNAAPLLAAYILCDVLLSVVMLVMIWKRMLPLKNTAQRILASFCNPIVLRGLWEISSRFCRGRWIRSITARNPPDTCWFWYWGWCCCRRRKNAENVRRQCNEIHGYANGNVGVVCRLIPKAVDGGVRL